MRNLVGAYCGVVAKWRCGNQNIPNLTADEIIALWKKNVSPTTVVGVVPAMNVTSRLWLPIHGMDQFNTMFPGLKVETAIYTLRDYRDARRRLKRKPDDREASAAMQEVTRFFHSDYFSLLTRLDGPSILQRLMEEK